eukprot:CAMPEP_0172779560 /NCGR_PEP_ID=MMETSP1074-20121228/202481_1 /TAXON_ID=2916 /ORGANISM="Ceratium fusus, Strain PA161109" /LENGTH=405 /DNA_ID=CAMNT_0013616523 /DNA_START=491 /DNA_END=1708 /DNA_ORIENTATION=-
MMSMTSRFAESYSSHWGLWEQRVAAGSQPRLPLTSGNFLVCINMFYLTFTLMLYRVMKTRSEPLRCRPFKTILLAYNFICVLLAGYVVWGIGTKLLSPSPYKFVCNKTVLPGSADDVNGDAAFMAHVFWVFYAQKFWEFLDTWFFIMRKSFRQVTFLHVFHHCSIDIVVGLILPFEFNGDMYLPIFLNALVHVLMYSHYLVSAMGLSTPWKPYLTSMQLLQFVIIASQSTISLSRGDTCGGPYFGKLLMVAYMGSMLILFGNFFLRSYILKTPSPSSEGVVKRFEPLQVTRSHTGRVQLDAAGCARVPVPAAFGAGTADGIIHYQLTPIGKAMPNLYISREPKEADCSFGIAGGVACMPVSWTVTTVVTLLGSPPPKPALCCQNPQESQGALCCQTQDTDQKKES